MAVALAQPIVFAGGSGATLSFSLGSAPTAGNKMVIAFIGSGPGVAPPLFTEDVNNQGTVNSSIYLCHRTVQGGDLAGPYTYTGMGTGWDGGGFIAELSGAGLPLVFSQGDAQWTLGTTSQISFGILTTAAGGMTFELYDVMTGAATIAQSVSDAVAQGFALLFHNAIATSASNKTYQVIANRSEAGVGSANPIATMPNVVTSSGAQSQLGFFVPAATGGGGGPIGNGSSSSCAGNGGLIPPAKPPRYVIA
jgi:hypothetical protein